MPRSVKAWVRTHGPAAWFVTATLLVCAGAVLAAGIVYHLALWVFSPEYLQTTPWLSLVQPPSKRNPAALVGVGRQVTQSDMPAPAQLAVLVSTQRASSGYVLQRLYDASTAVSSAYGYAAAQIQVVYVSADTLQATLAQLASQGVAIAVGDLEDDLLATVTTAPLAVLTGAQIAPPPRGVWSLGPNPSKLPGALLRAVADPGTPTALNTNTMYVVVLKGSTYASVASGWCSAPGTNMKLATLPAIGSAQSPTLGLPWTATAHTLVSAAPTCCVLLLVENAEAALSALQAAGVQVGIQHCLVLLHPLWNEAMAPGPLLAGAMQNAAGVLCVCPSYAGDWLAYATRRLGLDSGNPDTAALCAAFDLAVGYARINGPAQGTALTQLYAPAAAMFSSSTQCAPLVQLQTYQLQRSSDSKAPTATVVSCTQELTDETLWVAH